MHAIISSLKFETVLIVTVFLGKLLDKLLRTVPTSSKVDFSRFMNMPEKQILTSVIEIQKENWG